MSPSRGPRSSSNPARAVGHRRLAQLYVVASQCYAAGRIDEAVSYCDAGQPDHRTAGTSTQFRTSYETRPVLCTAWPVSPSGGPSCAAQRSQRQAGPHTITRACLVMALYMLRPRDEARVAVGRPARRGRRHSQSHAACFALWRTALPTVTPIPSPRTTPYAEP